MQYFEKKLINYILEARISFRRKYTAYGRIQRARFTKYRGENYKTEFLDTKQR